MNAVSDTELRGAKLPPAAPSAAARAVRDIVLGWDARMSPDSAGAACSMSTARAFQRAAFGCRRQQADGWKRKGAESGEAGGEMDRSLVQGESPRRGAE